MLYKKCVPQFEKKTQTLLAWLFIYTSFNLKKGRHWLYTVSYILCCTIHRCYSFRCSYLLFTISSIYICTFIKKKPHTQLNYIRNVGAIVWHVSDFIYIQNYPEPSITDNVYIPARNGKQKGWQKNTTIYKNIIPVYTDKLVYI